MTLSPRSKAITLLAGSLCLAGPAVAAQAATADNGRTGGDHGSQEKRIPGPAGSPRTPSKMQPHLSAKSCGPTAHDRQVAHKITARVHTDRMDGIDAGQVACARRIVSATRSTGLTPRAGQIALMTAMVESSLHNYRGGDRDSLGLFQQRPSKGWGTPAQIMNPEHATKKFLQVMQDMYPGGGWKHGDMGEIAQSVQRSAYPAEYDKQKSAAGVVLNALWKGGKVNPYTPKEVCGQGYSVIDSHRLGRAGKVYLLYNADNKKNCVTTLKHTKLGKDTATAAHLQVKGHHRATDKGRFGYYAGPVKRTAASTCVKWGGSAGGHDYTSGYEHCA